MKRDKPHTQPGWLRALFWLLLFSLPIAQAADFTFTPPSPIVEVGKKITLSVSGTDGEITWTPAKGFIDGTGSQVTYRANEVGNDVISVLDEAGNTGLVKIVIVPKEITPSLENANWEVFTNRSEVNALLLSDDGKTLWVGTNGGLEHWDANTRKLMRVFTNLDGLPSNRINVLESDSNGGLWIGTNKGLVYYSISDELTIYHLDNSGLPYTVYALENDSNGGLWIGVNNGLFYHSLDDEWTFYTKDNSELPFNSIAVLESDGNGGLWILTEDVFTGEEAVLVYRSVNGKWTVYTQDSLGLLDNELPYNNITVIESDGRGGLWIGTIMGGLAYHSINGDLTVYATDNSLISNNITAFLSDDRGGLWIGTIPRWEDEDDSGMKTITIGSISPPFPDGYIGGGLAYLSVSGEWTIYHQDNFGLSFNEINTILRDDNGGLWISASEGSLAYRSVSGEWTIHRRDTGLPDNTIRTMLRDGNDGLWIGTRDGLVYRSINGEWTLYSTNNSKLPNNNVKALENDVSGGLWIGTVPVPGGEILLVDSINNLAYRNISDKWTIYSISNSELPANRIYELESDDSEGMWIGVNGGLLYHNVSGEWTVYNTINNLELPNRIDELESDGKGGLWVGISDGLAYRNINGEWTVYTIDTSGLPIGYDRTLESDDDGGLWISTNTPEGSLAYRSVNNEWTTYTVDNLGWIETLESDGSGGIWIGISQQQDVEENNFIGGGLVYHSVAGNWTTYTTDNSGLPSNNINDLENDGNGGLWIGTYESGLAHLTFSQRNELCTNLNDAQCQTLLESNRAAILIAGGGTDSTNTLWDTTAGISNQIYKMLNRRGFDNDEIYYLSPQSYADFNGDGFDDCIVDAPATTRCRLQSVENPIPQRPLTVEDVRQAFTWAKTGGKLDYPLYVFFINHGGTDKFQLAKNSYLEVTEFKAILDDYQNATGNQLVLVIDACYSGVLLDKLKAENRAIISSTGNGLAYFYRDTKQGFSRFFSDGLLYGMSFHEAFGYATEEQNRLIRKNNDIKHVQEPQFYDGQEGAWLKKIFINGDFTVGDLTLNVEALTTATPLTAGQALNLQAKVTLAQGSVRRVWAILKPPRVNLVMDSNGTPILAFPSFNLYRTENEDIWATTWQDAVYNGEHEIVFYAEDNQANIANSEPVIITVNGGVDSPDQSKVQIVLEKDNYQTGESFKAELIEDLGWGYDLYAAVMFPDGNFLALKKTNDVAPVNQDKQWLGPRSQNQPITLFDLTLPDLPAGEYCIYGILSPEREDVFETLAQGLSVVEMRCVNIF